MYFIAKRIPVFRIIPLKSHFLINYGNLVFSYIKQDMKKYTFLLLFLGLNLGICLGQDSVDVSRKVLDQKYHDKVASMDAILESLYGVISGEKGEARNWELFNYLFASEAKLIPTGKSKGSNQLKISYFTPKQYEEMAGKYLVQNGFYEKEIHREVHRFGPLVQVFSTYETYHSSVEEKPFMRGINSIQLLDDGERWWVVNIYWVQESPKNPIPPDYLPR